MHYPHSLCFLVNTVDYFHSFISKVNNHLLKGLILLNWNICSAGAALGRVATRRAKGRTEERLQRGIRGIDELLFCKSALVFQLPSAIVGEGAAALYSLM